MRRIWKRLRRLWTQSRIRLPRRSLHPADLRRGDRLEIGAGVFRVRGSVVFRSGVRVFALDELNGGPEKRPVRLMVPPGGSRTWVLVIGGGRVGVPVEGVGWYPTGQQEMNAKTTEKSSRTDWDRVDAMKNEEIDTSDIPPLDKAFFTGATLRLPKPCSHKQKK